MPPLLTIDIRVWLLDQVVKLEDNRKLVQDKALKDEDSRELRYQSIWLVKNVETKSVK